MNMLIIIVNSETRFEPLEPELVGVKMTGFQDIDSNFLP